MQLFSTANFVDNVAVNVYQHSSAISILLDVVESSGCPSWPLHAEKHFHTIGFTYHPLFCLEEEGTHAHVIMQCGEVAEQQTLFVGKI